MTPFVGRDAGLDDLIADMLGVVAGSGSDGLADPPDYNSIR